MKKILFLTIMLMFIVANCFAMTFSQPAEIGVVENYGIIGGGYKFKGEVSNTGILYEINKEKYYKNGVVAFGKNEDLIYFHYNNKNYHDKDNIRNYGGKNLNNTFKATQAYGFKINQIKTDSNITFYLVYEWQFDVRGNKFALLGRKKDGTFVKYFDTWSISEKYFGNNYMGNGSFYDNWYCTNDSIIIEYSRYKKEKIKEGEFRFKWDDAAQ